MAIGSSSRGGARVRLVAVHTAEGARTAHDLRAYFDRAGINASSHTIIDHNDTLDLVPRDRAAWTLRSGNPISVNLETCAFARWSRAQWLSTGTIDGCVNPRAMLDRTATWIRRECDALNIPKVKLSSADVRAGKAGVIGHINWTEGMKDGSHWDPGPGFPWDYVMARVTGGGASAAPSPNGGGGSAAPGPEGIADMGFDPKWLPDSNGAWKYVTFPTECGKNSRVVGDLWFTIANGWGHPAEYEVIAMSGPGKYLNLAGSPMKGEIRDGERLHWKLPDTCDVIAFKYKTPANAQLSYAFPHTSK